jgi:carboxypeptidase Taq
MSLQDSYGELIRRSRETTLLASCSSLLAWDEETYMPAGGADHRSEQLALLAGMLHDRATDPRLGELLAELEGSELVRDPDSPEAVNVRELRRDFDRETRLPRSLVAELARTTSLAHQEWILARQNDEFARFRPWLEKIVSLKRAEADAVGYAAHPYDALIDLYEPGATTASAAALFDVLRDALVPLVAAIGSAPRRPKIGILHREYPVDRQRMLGESAAAAVGFDFTRGRIDLSPHPFCTGIGPGDTRLTSRFRADDFSEGLFAVLHESGHGLYEQGLDPAHHGTPMGESASLGVHESQSRLWENVVGRSRPFWEYWFPRARELFHDALQDATMDDLHFAVNEVHPSLNRVRADEVTYNLHIIVRFEIERALIAGDLAAADVPDAWNAGYRRYLGIAPENDAEGCLQDSHWSAGLIGYFPTYSIGDVIGSQLFAKASEELGDLPAAFRAGDFAPLLQWLRRNVHRQGRRWHAAGLVTQVTGSPPDPGALITRLRGKYTELYAL